jgi:putative ABC transport system permease protein
MFGPPREVIGVVGNLKHGGPQWPVQAEAFYLVNAAVASPLQVVLRVSPGASLPLDRIRQAAQGVGPRVLFDGVRSGSENFGARIVTPRHRAMLFSLLGGLGLLLALVGIASMTAYAVTRRTREIGIRMAFGARPADVVRTIVKDAAWPVLIGLLIGLGGARLATKIIASFLFETTPIDPGTFAATAGVLGVAACLAAWLPARHAARVDPVVALRAD